MGNRAAELSPKYTSFCSYTSLTGWQWSEQNKKY